MRKTTAGILCTLFGFAVGYGLLDGSAAIYTSMLVSYHLFLVYLIVTADHEKGMSMPIEWTLVTHMACLAVLLGMAYGREHIPFFGMLKYLVPALAPFEAEWLFSGRRKKMEGEIAGQAQVPMPEGTADDYSEFLAYLAQEKRPFSKPGRSVREEHVLWMADRVRKEAAAAAASARQRSATPAPR
jgi:hypothetical protein